MSCLERCPYFRGVLIEGFHCMYKYEGEYACRTFAVCTGSIVLMHTSTCKDHTRCTRVCSYSSQSCMHGHLSVPAEAHTIMLVILAVGRGSGSTTSFVGG